MSVQASNLTRSNSVANYQDRLTTLLNSGVDDLKAETDKAKDRLQVLQYNFARLIFLSDGKSADFSFREDGLPRTLNNSFRQGCIEELQYFEKSLSSYKNVTKRNSSNSYIDFILKIDYLVEKYKFKEGGKLSKKGEKFYKLYCDLILLNCSIATNYNLLNVTIDRTINRMSRMHAKEVRCFFAENKNKLGDPETMRQMREMLEINNWTIAKLNELKVGATNRLNQMQWVGEKVKGILVNNKSLTEGALDEMMQDVRITKAAFDINRFITNVRFLG